MRQNLRGKVVDVHIFDLGMGGKPKRIVRGRVKSIHTARSIRDTSYVELVDERGLRIPTHAFGEYEVVRTETAKPMISKIKLGVL